MTLAKEIRHNFLISKSHYSGHNDRRLNLLPVYNINDSRRALRMKKSRLNRTPESTQYGINEWETGTINYAIEQKHGDRDVINKLSKTYPGLYLTGRFVELSRKKFEFKGLFDYDRHIPESKLEILEIAIKNFREFMYLSDGKTTFALTPFFEDKPSGLERNPYSAYLILTYWGES